MTKLEVTFQEIGKIHLPEIRILPPVMSKEELAKILHDPYEDARDIAIESKRTRGEED